jgi:hypothetical protein
VLGLLGAVGTTGFGAVGKVADLRIPAEKDD